MKALILAAGLGTRLKPLTDCKPKALVEVNGITLLEHTIHKLLESDITEIIINVHHFSEQIKDYLNHKNNFGIHIEISDESGHLLDTGGGIKKVSWFFNDNEPFLVYNVDVLSDIDLENMYQSHIQSGALATLAVRQRQTSRYFLFNDELRLCGWKNMKTGEEKISHPGKLFPLAFSGVQILDPSIFNLMTETGKFSIIDVYLHLSAYHNITGFRHDGGYWVDLGKPASMEEARNFLNRNSN